MNFKVGDRVSGCFHNQCEEHDHPVEGEIITIDCETEAPFCYTVLDDDGEEWIFKYEEIVKVDIESGKRLLFASIDEPLVGVTDQKWQIRIPLNYVGESVVSTARDLMERGISHIWVSKRQYANKPYLVDLANEYNYEVLDFNDYRF